MSISLPARPHLDWYRKSAKKKLVALRAKSPTVKLAEAQLAVAREHGFDSWRKLVAAISAKAGGASASVADVFRDAARAIMRRDVEGLARLLRESRRVVNQTGAHPNWGGRPQLLHVAIEAGDEAIIRLLLDAGADPSGANDEYGGWSPIMLAMNWKRQAVADLLMDRGARVGLFDALMLADDQRALSLIDHSDLKVAAPNAGTPLHFARTHAAAKRLVERGISIGAKDKNGHTALDTAAARGDKAVVEFLLKLGSHATAETFAKVGDLKSLQRVLGKKKPSAAVLTAAIQGGRANVVRWLIERGADVNAAGDRDITPLHTAAWEGQLAIVKLLVKAGADVHAEDEQYSATPTGWAQHAAQNFNRIACVAVAGYLQQQEEKAPAEQKHTTDSQTTLHPWKPIMDAAFDGDAGKIKKLLKAGADPNAVSTTPHGYRPLHRAIEQKKTFPRGAKHEAVVKILLDAGADPHLRAGLDRFTALQMAALGSPRFVQLLVKAFRPLDFLHACVVLDLDRVKLLLNQDSSLASRADVNGYTPLHYVAGSRMYLESSQLAENQLEIARRLITAGASVSATYLAPGSGNWPIPVLYMACGFTNNPLMTELLMEAGAQPFDGESVYHASDEGHAECLAVIERLSDPKKLAAECTKCLRQQMHWGKSRGAKWLLEHGADPNSLHPQFGNSALHQAVLLGSSDKVLSMLLEHGGYPMVKNRERKSAIDLARAMKKERLLRRLASF